MCENPTPPSAPGTPPAPIEDEPILFGVIDVVAECWPDYATDTRGSDPAISKSSKYAALHAAVWPSIMAVLARAPVEWRLLAKKGCVVRLAGQLVSADVLASSIDGTQLETCFQAAYDSAFGE